MCVSFERMGERRLPTGTMLALVCVSVTIGTIGIGVEADPKRSLNQTEVAQQVPVPTPLPPRPSPPSPLPGPKGPGPTDPTPPQPIPPQYTE